VNFWCRHTQAGKVHVYVIFSPNGIYVNPDEKIRKEGEREINRENGQRETDTGRKTIVDKTSSESPHVLVLSLIKASGLLLKINVTSPI